MEFTRKTSCPRKITHTQVLHVMDTNQDVRLNQFNVSKTWEQIWVCQNIYCTMNFKHFYQPGTFKMQKVNSDQHCYYRAQANKSRLLQESFCMWRTASIWYQMFNQKTRRGQFSRNRYTLSKHHFFVNFLTSQSYRRLPVVLALKPPFFF